MLQILGWQIWVGGLATNTKVSWKLLISSHSHLQISAIASQIALAKVQKRRGCFFGHFFNPHFYLKATRHPNNFFHKLCSSDTLIGAGLYRPVRLGYTFRKTKVSAREQKNVFGAVFFFFFFNPHFYLKATRHPNNFFP